MITSGHWNWFTLVRWISGGGDGHTQGQMPRDEGERLEVCCCQPENAQDCWWQGRILRNHRGSMDLLTP